MDPATGAATNVIVAEPEDAALVPNG